MPPIPRPPAPQQQDVISIIVRVAQEMGVPPQLALSVAMVESGLNPRAVGDNGTSFGLYQLHKGGMLTSARLTPEQAFDPETNARVAISSLAGTLKKNPGASWGVIAARSQRPADAAGYARKVDGLVRSAGTDYVRYFAEQADRPTAATSTAGPTGGMGAAVGDTRTTQAAPVTDQQLRDYVRTNYPDAAPWLNHPELGPILMRAARERWDGAKLQGAVAGTKWWKTTQSQQREWDALVIGDRATAHARMVGTEFQINRLARQLGVSADRALITQMAVNVNRNGWSAEQVQEALAARFEFAPQNTGRGATTAGGLKALAAQYAVSLGDDTVEQWTRQILGGTRTDEDFRVYLVNQAKGRYANNAALAAALDAGQTVRQLADPLLRQANRLLGLDPTTVDLNDPRWMKMLQTYDDASKSYRPMTEYEAMVEIKTNPGFGYRRSLAGRQEEAEYGMSLARSLGAAV